MHYQNYIGSRTNTWKCRSGVVDEEVEAVAEVAVDGEEDEEGDIKRVMALLSTSQVSHSY